MHIWDEVTEKVPECRLQSRERWANCSGVSVLPVQAFYPVNWVDIIKFFRRPTVDSEIKWQVMDCINGYESEFTL